MAENKKKQKFIILACVLAGVCLAGTVVAALSVLRQKNPLAAGLAGLAEEMTAWEAELGENFWTDAINQIGSGNAQAEYSLNIGGVPSLQNVTVGVDGRARRDMERQVFASDIQLSVTNAEIANASVYGTAESLLVQVPSVWDGSVVFDTENISGQWDDSFIRKQIQGLTGEELGIYRRIDARMFEGFSVEPFSIAGFLAENEEALRALYENMEVIRLEKARKEGMIGEGQAEDLESYVVSDAEEKQIETTCYLVILPGKELGEIFSDVTDNIRLGVYLDQDRRIVRICTLPEEVLVTDSGERKIGLNLTGMEATIERLEIAISDVTDADKIFLEGFDERTGKVETECCFLIEKESGEKGSYAVEGNTAVTYQDAVWELSGTANIQGEQREAEKKIFLDVANLTLKSSNEVVGRFSGNAAFEPLTENIELPAGKENRIEEMSEAETMLFLAECVGNVYKNYSGYLRMLQ